MILLLHISIALFSVSFSTYLLFRPSVQNLRISYLFVALTLASGAVLLLSKPVNMVQTCFVGLLYIAFVTYTIAAARKKLAKEFPTKE